MVPTNFKKGESFMKKIVFMIFILLFMVTLDINASEKIKVVTSYKYIQSIVEEIGKEAVEVISLSKGTEDPHFIVPKPSLIAKLRQADLFIINGASLEIGFVPPLLNQANNNRVNPGSNGFLDLSLYVNLIDKPEKVSRTEGDVHPEGNPHFNLSYNNLPQIAKAILEFFIKNYPEKKDFFQKNFDQFITTYEEKKKIWDEKIKKLSGKNVIQYHRIFNYIAKDTGMNIFAEIEPKPGIPPTAKHIEEIKSKAKNEKIYKILTDVYHERKSAEKLGKELNCPVVVIPHDVGSIEEADNIFSFYETIVRRLSDD